MPINENLFLKAVKQVGKAVLLCTLLWFFIKLIFAVAGNDTLQMQVGFFIFIFITLPTIYWIFIKQKISGGRASATLERIWKVYRVFYIIFIALWLGIWGLGYGRVVVGENQTQNAIDFINSKKITLADVMGQNLPPKPNQTQNDLTIAGIDANNNYIRDDVELAIFEKYPNSAKIRSAMLQYAQALQLELTHVTSSETLVPVMQKIGLSKGCLGDVVIDNSKAISVTFPIFNKNVKEIEDLVLSTELRKAKDSDIYEKYMIGYAFLNDEHCDVDLSTLSN